jgi:hypothetical protein
MKTVSDHGRALDERSTFNLSHKNFARQRHYTRGGYRLILIIGKCAPEFVAQRQPFDGDCGQARRSRSSQIDDYALCRHRDRHRGLPVKSRQLQAGELLDDRVHLV